MNKDEIKNHNEVIAMKDSEIADLDDRITLLENLLADREIELAGTKAQLSLMIADRTYTIQAA